MMRVYLRSILVLSAVCLTGVSSPALGVTRVEVDRPPGASTVTTTLTNRAKIDVAIRRIRGLLTAERGTNEKTFEQLQRVQKEYQGSR